KRRIKNSCKSIGRGLSLGEYYMAAKLKKAFVTPKKEINEFPYLKNILPPGCDYLVDSYEECEDHEGEKRFNATFRIARSQATKDGMRQWIRNFCNHSLTTYRTERTYPLETKWFMYRVDLRCHHNTKPSSHKRVRTPHKKHTACPAKMTIKIRQDKLSKRKCHELHLKTHPVEVSLYHLHNHITMKKDALRFRDPESALVEKFRKMYRAGYKPAAALEIHKRDLRMEYEDDYPIALEDRGLCPDMNWCYRQYYLTSKEPQSNNAVTSQHFYLEEVLAKYNRKCGKNCVLINVLHNDKNNLVVALITPLMKRCHRELAQSGKCVSVDSVKLDYLRCRVYILITHSEAGGLPLGVLITSSDCTSVVLEALHLFTNLLSEQDFGGKGAVGPAVIMTQDDKTQQGALTAAFPKAVLLLCPYHIVQSAWECLCGNQVGVDSGSRQELFEMVKEMVSAKSSSDLEEMYKKLMTSPQAQFSLKFFNHMEELYSRRCEWAICLREDLLHKMGNTDIVTLTMNSLKDKILCQTKACTIVQLFEFLTGDMEEYYKNKISHISSNKGESAFLQLYLPDKKMMETLEIVPYFKIKNTSNGECYDIDMSCGLCSCSVGARGEPCRHRYTITQKLNINSLVMQPVSHTSSIKELRRIASWLQDQKIRSRTEENQQVLYESNVIPSIGDFEGYVLNTSRKKQVSEEKPVCKEMLNGIETQNTVNLNHASLRSFTCLICSKILMSHAQLVRHKIAHNHNKPLVCHICGLGFNTKQDHQHHCLQKHVKEKPYECEVCGKSFVDSVLLHEHVLVHNQKRAFPCEMCGKLFRTPKCAIRHKKRHEKGSHLSGPQCNKSFLVKSDFQAQMHKGESSSSTIKTIVEVRDPLHYPHDQQEQEVIIINAEDPLAATVLPSSVDKPKDGPSNCSYQVPLATPVSLESSEVHTVHSVFQEGAIPSQQVNNKLAFILSET
ncbi:hypothetical protein OTU49_009151, partial [Cherax quadricarinatus]